MKFDCDKRHDRLTDWHRWFAWYSVRIGKNDCRWFEYVERKGKNEFSGMSSYWSWEYKAIDNEENA